MINAWQVYLVMQLDKISYLFLYTSMIFVIISLIIFVLTEGEESKLSVKFLFAGLSLSVLCAITPSSKTAAAMIILPAMTSDESMAIIKPEAKELYNLTKDALRGLSGKDSVNSSK